MKDQEEIIRKHSRLKKSAKDRGIAFNLTVEKVCELMSVEFCYYTGVKMTKSDRSKLESSDRTIDRKDPDKGYHMKNVVACCYSANTFKETIERQFIGLIGRDEIKKVILRMFE